MSEDNPTRSSSYHTREEILANDAMPWQAKLSMIEQMDNTSSSGGYAWTDGLLGIPKFANTTVNIGGSNNTLPDDVLFEYNPYARYGVSNRLDPKTERRYTDPDTGGEKGSKPEKYSLIPVEALAEVAKVYDYGSRKYAPNNWRKGYPWSLSYDALQRHVNAFWGGENSDPESGLPHLAHAIFHCMSLIAWSQDPGNNKDDRPS